MLDTVIFPIRKTCQIPYLNDFFIPVELLTMKDQLGSIEAGKLADIVAVDGDPLTLTQKFLEEFFVMKDGVIY